MHVAYFMVGAKNTTEEKNFTDLWRASHNYAELENIFLALLQDNFRGLRLFYERFFYINKKI
jgi:hypothetical protein